MPADLFSQEITYINNKKKEKVIHLAMNVT